MISSQDQKKLGHYLDLAIQAVSLGRKVLLNYYGQLSHVSEKKLAGLVSEADLRCEEVMTDFLQAHAPELDMLGEESSYQNQSLSESVKTSSSKVGRWILDPLDGTTNYIYQFPIFCISLGLELSNELVLGVVDVPLMHTQYTAVQGKGAFKNERKIQVSQRKKLKEALLATGFIGEKPEVLQHQLKIFNRLVSKTRAIRRAGSAAFDLCMVAEGVFDGFWEEALSPWDTAAGVVLVREAGGQVSDYLGHEFQPDMNTVLATNGAVHKILLEELK